MQYSHFLTSFLKNAKTAYFRRIYAVIASISSYNVGSKK